MNLGKQGEEAAYRFLAESGYEVLERNYRIGRDELDIIARHDNMLVILEVKTRSSNSHGYPEEFVNAAKQKRMVRAAAAYLEAHFPQASLRFDVISVELKRNSLIINHFKDAFYPYQE
ncbi:MAG: YraN family protein [Bacteroidetes bacterium]|nr:YraN family protein [Bacteroidota bacterium]